MSHDPNLIPVFSIDVTAESPSADPTLDADPSKQVVTLLSQLVVGQQQQNQLLEDLNQNLTATQKQRTNELGQWKEANPDLAQHCRVAAETLSRVQTNFLESLTEEITDNEDCLLDGEFMLNEFVDRFGPRLAHLNGVLQVLSQLSSMPPPANTQQ